MTGSEKAAKNRPGSSKSRRGRSGSAAASGTSDEKRTRAVRKPETHSTPLKPGQAEKPTEKPTDPSEAQRSAADDDASMSSRGNQRRGPNRNSEVGEHGEELSMWKDVKEKLGGAIDAFNDSSANVVDIRDQEKRMAEKRDKGSIAAEDYNKLDSHLRKGVKSNEAASQSLGKIIEELKILRAVQKAKEEQQEQSASRQRAPPRDLYDFEGGDSPVPSPNPSVSRRMGSGGGGLGGNSKGERGDRGERGDSVPPKFQQSQDRSTPAAKAGSAEPQQPGASTSTTTSSSSATAGNLLRSRQAFAKDDEVAFKPKPAANEQTDWILGIVQEVRGEGKSRRYRVLDADVDENGHQKDFRTSASSMIPIPKEGTVLAPLDEGRVVLALYPNTTTFYKAEVIGMDGDAKVNLKFEGEESSNTMQAVTRRHVVEYRG
ncbi:SGF29 tudor-like domain-containing protein [Xylariaceae sp. FL0804]|nr:SGF29 tudor-like domain-containing protein [Xylariaceae sp. FL0804]